MSKIHQLLIDKINKNEKLIEDWFQDKFLENKPIFYNSVDLRHSGFKIAPIDTNCFPAGFNNFCELSKSKAQEIVNNFLNENYPNISKILLIPENHTRNIRYLTNVLALQEIISGNGLREVVIGSLIEEMDDRIEIDLENNKKIILDKLIIGNNKIITKSGFESDLIIVNNDFTNQPGNIFKNISQDIIPPLSIGWHNRMKSTHFDVYNQLITQFCELINIDPWLISTFSSKCSGVNFKEKKGIEDLAKKVDEVILNIKEKYSQYNIKSQPYVYVKAEKGTYGIGIMTVQSGQEIIDINKKQRNKMSMIKGNVEVHQVIIQEGVPTIDQVNDVICEPMIYLMDGKIVSSLFRINNDRGIQNSLNSPGMSFRDLNDVKDSELSLGLKRDEVVKIYSLISRLAALAASCE
jgi:glutamate--cysteine ligase